MCQIGIALELNFALIGTLAGGGAFAVTSVHAINNIHAFNNLSNGTKALIIQKCIALVTSVDEYLCRATIGASRGKDNGTTCVGDLDGVVLEILASPFALYGGVAVNAKLNNKARNDAKDATIVPEAGFSQLL